MYPFGGALTKLLATVAAFMTVTTGVPRVQCVCSDGRVKLFCPGPSASGCCCAGPSSPDTPGAGPRSYGATRGTRTCCARAANSPPTRPAGDGLERAGKACGCERTMVAAPVAYTAEHAGEASQIEPDASVSRDVTSDTPEQTARLARVKSRLLHPPPDLVILLCHFTC